jgi:hypothetical protein
MNGKVNEQTIYFTLGAMAESSAASARWREERGAVRCWYIGHSRGAPALQLSLSRSTSTDYE